MTSLLEIARSLPLELAGETLELAEAITNKEQRAQAIGCLTVPLARARPDLIGDLVRQVLRLLSEGSRSVFLGVLPDLIPALVIMGGPGALAETASHVISVARWWP